jgi:hypothetical protein
MLVVLFLHLLRFGTVLRLPLLSARTSEFFPGAMLKKFFARAEASLHTRRTSYRMCHATRLQNNRSTSTKKGESLMYCDINQVTYNAKKNLAVIEGIDLDTVLLNSWSQEFSDQAEVTFQFDLTQKGQRIYLYKLLKSVVKEDCKSMEEMLMALTGKITNISANFIAKTEG